MDMKSFVKRVFRAIGRYSKFIKNRFTDWELIQRVPFNLLVINFIFQRIFRINSEFPYPIHFTSRVISGKNIKIIGSGKDTVYSFSVSGSCYYQALNGIVFNTGIRIAPGVKIISANHDIYDLKKIIKSKPVIIGENVWIGANCVILPEVEIAKGNVIGANSVVTKSFMKENTVIAGNPAKIIKSK